jgi:hypothetical protein
MAGRVRGLHSIHTQKLAKRDHLRRSSVPLQRREGRHMSEAEGRRGIALTALEEEPPTREDADLLKFAASGPIARLRHASYVHCAHVARIRTGTSPGRR